MADDLSINDLVAAYRRIRATIAEEEELHEAKIKGLKEKMELVSTELLNFCNEQNLDSIRTPEGTVSRRVQTRYWSTDWEEMYKFIEEHNVPFVLEKRIHNGNMKQFLEENPDVLPVGLQVDNKYVIQVRKPTEK
jgi:hypothetical protein